jgi:hypothetical protein
MKRSDLLGGSSCVFNSSDNAEGNEANEPSSEDDKGNTLSADTAHSRAHSCRKEAMAKKNFNQQLSAIKAMKHCGKTALAARAGIGAVVSLKVDYCTHSHAQGLLAIVYKVNESTGGILVCCQHGVITHDGTRGNY